jgi:probable rRNA maturation factor
VTATPNAGDYAVSVEPRDPRFVEHVGPITHAVRRALVEENAPNGSQVAVVLCDDEEIAEYHERFMGIAGPTDVMSWPSDSPPLGDVLVSVETAARQAAALGHSLGREVRVLAVHGVLHLLGWDDQTPEDRGAMQARVDALVAADEER